MALGAHRSNVFMDEDIDASDEEIVRARPMRIRAARMLPPCNLRIQTKKIEKIMGTTPLSTDSEYVTLSEALSWSSHATRVALRDASWEESNA